MGNPKLVLDLKSDLDSKNASVVPMCIWWAIQPYFSDAWCLIYFLAVEEVRIFFSRWVSCAFVEQNLNHWNDTYLCVNTNAL